MWECKKKKFKMLKTWRLLQPKNSSGSLYMLLQLVLVWPIYTSKYLLDFQDICIVLARSNYFLLNQFCFIQTFCVIMNDFTFCMSLCFSPTSVTVKQIKLTSEFCPDSNVPPGGKWYICYCLNMIKLTWKYQVR